MRGKQHAQVTGCVCESWCLWRTRPPACLPACVLQIASSGLEYLHGQGVVHGDLKPLAGNVLRLVLHAGAEVALADFGFSRLRQAGEASAAELGGGSSTLRRGAGTAPYMAPELFAKDKKGVPVHTPSFASDIYAFAITAWCVLRRAKV